MKERTDMADLFVIRNLEVVGKVFCINDQNREVYIKEEEFETPIERDPLDLSGDENRIKPEIEESSSDCHGIITAKAVTSDDQMTSHPIKGENEDQLTSVDTNEVIIPDNTSATEAMQIKEEYPVFNNSQEVDSPYENTVYSDHSVKEDLEDVTSESCYNTSFEEGIPRTAEDELTEHVVCDRGFSQEMSGPSYMSRMSEYVHSVGHQDDSKGTTGVSTSSRVEYIHGNAGDVPKSNPMSSRSHVVHSSCHVDTERDTTMLRQCHDEYSVVSNLQNPEMIKGVVENVFKCVKCFKEFPTSDSLRSHMLTHSGKELFEQGECSSAVRRQSINIKTCVEINSVDEKFQCTHCQETFSHIHQLKQHLFHSGDGRFMCDQCSTTFYCKNHLIEHTMSHDSSDKTFYCNSCNKAFLRKDKLKVHTIVHTDEKLFVCELCGKSFTQKGSLTVHARIHSGEKPFKCDQCPKAFATNGNLNKHLRVHSGERPYECCDCGKPFGTNSDLRKHMRIHSGEKPHHCSECGKSFSIRSNLTKHMRIHSGEKPHNCSQCEKSFSSNSDLTKHLRTHSGERPHKCDQCEKCFSSKSDLIKHSRVHSGERPYKCDQCGKPFATNSDLKKHLSVHSVERPYRCLQCGRCFSTNSNLRKHLRVHSGERSYK